MFMRLILKRSQMQNRVLDKDSMTEEHNNGMESKLLASAVVLGNDLLPSGRGFCFSMDKVQVCVYLTSV